MSAIRKIIKIDEGLCNGCKLCIPNCPEGALQIIDGKARLISDLFCDGLGACIGHCPQGAITVEERNAEPYAEAKVMENIVKKGENTTRAHLIHLLDHGEKDLYEQAVAFLKSNALPNPCETQTMEPAHHGGCPGSRIRELKPAAKTPAQATGVAKVARESNLQTWPIQLHLMALPAFE
jgi:ferredoxin